jgi:hypothetical protein
MPVIVILVQQQQQQHSHFHFPKTFLLGANIARAHDDYTTTETVSHHP